ncbi:MAG: Do family serine endopeptidase [Deltaproteobacteria bacterium]|nr:Do family serine endopeptidase [Deltaproteobacteria bacterium]
MRKYLIFLLLCLWSSGTVQAVGWFTPSYPGSFSDLIKRVQPAVVNISTTKTVKLRSPFDEFFRQHYGLPPRNRRQNSLGSGFIIDKDGHILTNNHVVMGADEIIVNLSDGRTFQAKVIGKDLRTDIAVIKISAKGDLPTVQLGDSDVVQVGDWVLAIGNPFGLGQTVTAGIISAKGRHIGAGPYDNFIQTDASINPGNSGGPLFNLSGEVVGLNTAVVQSGQGIGFAIPINLVKNLAPQLIKGGKVDRGYLGVSIQEVPSDLANVLGIENGQGAMVADVVKGSPAALAGMEPGDIVTEYDGRALNSAGDLPLWVSDTPIGKTVEIKFLRRHEHKAITVKIGNLTQVGDIS